MLTFTRSAIAVPIILYDGSTIPNSQGWTQEVFLGGDGGTNTVTVNGTGTTSFTSTLMAENIYLNDTGATDYVVSMRVKVESADWNPFDFGLGLSPFTNISGLPQSSVSRINSLAFTTTEIKWADGGASSAIGTSVFHEYAMAYINGDLSVYIDETFSNIIGGIATPVLVRTGVSPTRQVGIIAFGDMTNDTPGGPYVNSDYELDFVQFESIDTEPIPEPATIALLGIGLVGLVGVAVRRKYKKDKKDNV